MDDNRLVEFMGYKVFISPLLDGVPKVQLSESVVAIIEPINPQFVVDMNKWLAEFFGTEDRVIVNRLDNAVMVGPNTHERMNAAYALMLKR